MSKFWENIRLDYPIHYDIGIYKFVVETNLLQSIATLLTLWALSVSGMGFESGYKTWLVNLCFVGLVAGTVLAHIFLVKFSLRKISNMLLGQNTQNKGNISNVVSYAPTKHTESQTMLKNELELLKNEYLRLQLENRSLKNTRSFDSANTINLEIE
jgi:hypothetical protein